MTTINHQVTLHPRQVKVCLAACRAAGRDPEEMNLGMAVRLGILALAEAVISQDKGFQSKLLSEILGDIK